MLNSIIIGLVASMFLVASESRQNDEIEEYRVCSTDVCKERAKLINESMLQSVNACYDFHSYVCGGWEKKHDRKWSYSIYDMLADKVKATTKREAFLFIGFGEAFIDMHL
ncbi:hypothetical protein V5799_012441 [Amblyomma americanum]|uniref:M13 family peptidase n=1 Tax=Amblyomma americanum TaxID=6943 RepID=A0AAQ4EEF9_AMBAM